MSQTVCLFYKLKNRLELKSEKKYYPHNNG